jgi:hypothetical protein
MKDKNVSKLNNIALRSPYLHLEQKADGSKPCQGEDGYRIVIKATFNFSAVVCRTSYFVSGQGFRAIPMGLAFLLIWLSI